MMPETGQLIKNRDPFLSVPLVGKSTAAGPTAGENILVPTNVRRQEARRYMYLQTFEKEKSRAAGGRTRFCRKHLS